MKQVYLIFAVVFGMVAFITICKYFINFIRSVIDDTYYNIYEYYKDADEEAVEAREKAFFVMSLLCVSLLFFIAGKSFG